MCGIRGLLIAAAWVLLLALVGPMLEALTARHYPVHTSGCVLVTGASSGIGRAAVLELLKHNFQVLAGVRKMKDAQDLSHAAAGWSSHLEVLTLDVTLPIDIDKAVHAVERCGQPFVGLVNNAGVTAKGPMETVSMERVRGTFDVNLFGVVELTQRLLPALRKSQGRIVNIGSVAGSISTQLSGVYSATKFALEAVSDALRLELTPFNISVSMVNPAYVTTDIRLKSLDQVSTLTALEQQYYSDLFARSQAKEPSLRELGSPCCAVTDADIVHALTSPTPRTRYYPGMVMKDVPASFVVPVIKFFGMHPILERILDYLLVKL